MIATRVLNAAALVTVQLYTDGATLMAVDDQHQYEPADGSIVDFADLPADAGSHAAFLWLQATFAGTAAANLRAVTFNRTAE